MVVAALTVAVGAIAVSRLGGEEPPVPAAVTTRFAGIPQDGITLGTASAPATLVEFADLQCPYCGAYGRDVLPSVVERYVKPGRLRLELNLLTFVGEDSVRAGRVATAAAAKGRFWDFTDAFYARQGEENSGYVTDAFLGEVNAAAGIDVQASGDTTLLDKAQAAADRLGVKSTPSFFVRRGDGELTPLEFSDLTPDAFATALDKALAQ